jgi:hypothetical protein
MEYNVGGTEVWQFNIQSDGSVKGEITYPANSLYSNLTTSERGFWTKELKDKQGRIIAKMQQLNTDDVATTAYCYNDLTGNLRNSARSLQKVWNRHRTNNEFPRIG